jgi:O-antigen ligase
MALILCLFGERLEFSKSSIVVSISREVEGVFCDPQTQSMAVVCAGTYLAALGAIRNRRFRERRESTSGVELWRCAFLLIAAFLYWLGYQHASKSTQTVNLLVAAVLGSGAEVNVFWRDDFRSKKASLWCSVALVVVLVTFACFWQSSDGPSFTYNDRVRWMGPWNNPNLYGLLMASCAVLAIGLAISNAGGTKAPGWRWKLWNRLKSALFLAVGALCFGLWKSYSRGAWLAAGVGGLYLLIQWCKRSLIEAGDRIRWMRICFSLAIVLCALVALMFWKYQHAENVTVRRAISAADRNDLSWGNRVAAWEGALQMMAERPWVGLGWNQPDPFYRHYYFTSRIDETGAVQLNDYLMLGATLGIPALFCFCMYLWLALTQKLEIGNRKSEMAQLAWLKTVCRARALVLAVGFWFDGGLFKLPTAATFWILLELGREN